LVLHQLLIHKGRMQIRAAGTQLSQFIRESPIVSGAVIGGTVLGGGLIAAQQIRKRSRRRVKRRVRRAVRRTRARLQPRRHKVRRVHKHRRKGLDIIHRGKKRGISLKAIRASIASPRTPAPLKRGLRKLLKRRAGR